MKKILMTGLLFISAGQVNTAFSHEIRDEFIISGQYGEVDYGATDVWRVDCSGGSDRLVLRVRDLTSGISKVAAQVIKVDGLDIKALNTVDSRGGDAGYSPFVRLNAGDGRYTILVNQSVSDEEEGNEYDLEFHCENNSGTHTPTTQFSDPIQDN